MKSCENMAIFSISTGFCRFLNHQQYVYLSVSSFCLFVRWDSSDFLPRLRHLEKQLQDSNVGGDPGFSRPFFVFLHITQRVQKDNHLKLLLMFTWLNFLNYWWQQNWWYLYLLVWFPNNHLCCCQSHGRNKPILSKNSREKIHNETPHQGAIRRSSRTFSRTVQGRCCIHKKPKSRCDWAWKFSIHWDIFIEPIHSSILEIHCTVILAIYSHRLHPIHQYLKKNQRRLCLPTFFSALEENYNHHWIISNKNHLSCTSSLSAYKTGFCVLIPQPGGFRCLPDPSGRWWRWWISLRNYSWSMGIRKFTLWESGGNEKRRRGRVATRVIYSDSCHSIRLV